MHAVDVPLMLAMISTLPCSVEGRRSRKEEAQAGFGEKAIKREEIYAY
jgi:hypothetical protein